MFGGEVGTRLANKPFFPGRNRAPPFKRQDKPAFLHRRCYIPEPIVALAHAGFSVATTFLHRRCYITVCRQGDLTPLGVWGPPVYDPQG